MTSAPFADGPRPDARMRVLIADDEPFVRSMLLRAARPALRRRRVRPPTPRRRSRSRGEHRPDAAIVDVEMPAGGGLRATRGIRVCSPQTAILVLSSDESDAGVVTMLQAGAVSYFRKGLNAGELASALSESVRAHAKLSAAS